MLAFPQLASGATAQFPFRREIRFRTRRNEATDGSSVASSDLEFETRIWRFEFRDLTDGEWQALSALHEATVGRMGTFTFLEPAANLLTWSERLTEAPWAGSAGVSDGQGDPWGGSRGSRIEAGGTVAQTLAGPGWHRYAASAWLRTTAAGGRLRFGPAGAAVEAEADASGEWRRYVVAYPGGSTAEQVTLSLEAPAGGALDVFGAQVEAQPTASAYKRSGGRGGVYPGARFERDELAEVATGPGRRDAQVGVIWTRSQA